MNSFFYKMKPNEELENRLTLWLNHLLVLYSFLIPIHNKSKSSIFFLMLIVFLYRMNFVKYLKDAFYNKIIQALMIFYFILILGFLYTENIGYAMSSMDKVKYILFPLVFLSFLDKRFAPRVLISFILGVIFSSLCSYLIKFNIIPTSITFFDYEIYKTNIFDSSPFFNYIDMGIGISVVISILLLKVFDAKTVLRIRLLYISLVVFFIGNLSFLPGRTGYVVSLFLILFVIFYSFKNSKKILLSIIILLIPLVSIIYLNSPVIQNRVGTTISSINKIVNEQNYRTSIGLRIGFTVYSLKVIEKNLFLGVGTGDYMDEVRKIIPEKYKFLKDKHNIAQPHNVYIKTLLQVGLIGLFSLFFILYRLATYKDCNYFNRGILLILSISMFLFMFPGKLYGLFVFPMVAILISTSIVSKEWDIEFKEFSIKSFFIYSFFLFLFLILGIIK